jgi:hypothetical protein
MTAAQSTQHSPAVPGSGTSSEDSLLHLAFVDVVCGDDQLVAAEFEAIIAACWDSPGPPGAVMKGAGPRRSPAAGPRVVGPQAPALKMAMAGRRAARQRSPPPE